MRHRRVILHTPPSPLTGPREPLVFHISHVHKYDTDEVFRFGERVSTEVRRTEGGIKVDLHDTEGGIFDFDRQCGSHGLFLCCVCVCVRFTLSLFTKRDRMAGSRFQSPFSHQLGPLNHPECKEICISLIVEQELTDDIVRFSLSCFCFRSPAVMLSPEAFSFPVLSPSLVSCGDARVHMVMPDMSPPGSAPCHPGRKPNQSRNIHVRTHRDYPLVCWFPARFAQTRARCLIVSPFGFQCFNVQRGVQSS